MATVRIRETDSESADTWLIIDDELEGGKVDVSNEPAWDGTIAPYKLFIQHGNKKSTHSGGWNVIAQGELNPAGYPEFDSTPWQKWRLDIGGAFVVDTYKPLTCAGLFDGLNMCSTFDLRRLDTSDSTSIRNMFRGCSSVRYLFDVERFNTSNVTNADQAFMGCISLKVVNLAGWDVSTLVSAENMFESCGAFVLMDSNMRDKVSALGDTKMFGHSATEGSWMRAN
ncbi:MAG: DUF285 domain-containing protein [Olsenella sp.]|jgi:surface protein|nr:DUF285 domain-containing protein [Olsenella sp.]